MCQPQQRNQHEHRAFHQHNDARKVSQNYRWTSHLILLLGTAIVLLAPPTAALLPIVPSHVQHHSSISTLTELSMLRNRGLERQVEGATPTEGGMTLYVKAGPDGKSLGDCPFAHYVRMVLHAKGLEYDLRPSVQDTKPQWLIQYYDGKMPALRHRRECYVESDTIAAYLDFFFATPAMTTEDATADAAMEGFFSAVAQFLKHTPDGDAAELPKRERLCERLAALDAHLATGSGPYMTGDGLMLQDCKLAPQIYVLYSAMAAFKTSSAIDVATDYPAVHAYMQHMLERDPAFRGTACPASVVEWGWGKARAPAKTTT